MIAVLAFLALAGAGGTLAYQTAARQREYRLQLARGDAALRDDQTFAAIEAYSGAIVLRPDSMLAYLRRGETYRRRADRGDLDAAARDFRKAASLDPSATRPLEELGDVLYQLQRFDRAVDAYERFAALDDRSARINYKLAVARYRNGQADAAIAALNQAVRLDDRLADAYYVLGVCLRQKGRRADALKALEKAVALSPALIPARDELAEMYGELDRRADQLEQLQLLAGLDRDRAERHVAVAFAHARAGHRDAAVLAIRNALDRMRDDPVLYRALGQIWLESAQARVDRVDLKKAREALDHAAANPAATSEALALAASAALEDGDLDVAERALKRAATRFPIDAAALLLYATVAERQNHPDDARRALIQYSALTARDSDLPARASRIAVLSLRVGDVATAAAWIRRGLQRDPQHAQLVALARRLGI